MKNIELLHNIIYTKEDYLADMLRGDIRKTTKLVNGDIVQNHMTYEEVLERKIYIYNMSKMIEESFVPKKTVYLFGK